MPGSPKLSGKYWDMLLRPHEIVYGAVLFIMLGGKRALWLLPVLVLYDLWSYVDFTTDTMHILAYVLSMKNLVYIVSIVLLWKASLTTVDGGNT